MTLPSRPLDEADAGAPLAEAPNAAHAVHVLLILTSLARTSPGGQSFCEGLTKALAGRARLSVVLPAGHPLASGHLGDDRFEVLTVRPYSGMLRVLRDMLTTWRWAQRSKANVVLLPHEWAAPTLGVPLVNVIQNVLFLDPRMPKENRLKGLGMRMAIKGTASLAHRTIAVSPYARDIWHQSTGRDAVVLAQGVREVFKEARLDARRDLVVVITGAASYKNPSLASGMIGGLRELGLADTIVVVGLPVGAIEPAPGLELYEHLTPPKLAVLFGRARVVVVTSALESFGLPAFEALSAGARIVIPSETAMSEWLRDESGVMVAPATSAAMVEAVARVWTASPPTSAVATKYSWEALGELWASEMARAAAQEAGQM